MACKWTHLFPPFSICEGRVGKVNEGPLEENKEIKIKLSVEEQKSWS